MQAPSHTSTLALSCFVWLPWAAAIAISTVSAWKNNMGAMDKCHGLGHCHVAFIHGTHGKKSRDGPERNPFRVTW